MIYVYSLNIFKKIKIFFLYIAKKKLLYAQSFVGKENVKYLHSNKYSITIAESRKLVFEYFDNKFSYLNKKEEGLNNYIKKYYDFKFTDFFFFMKSIKEKKIHYSNIIADNVLKNIYYKKYNFSIYQKFINIYLSAFSILKFNLFFVKTLFICLLTPSNSKYDNPQILYLRKKDYVDFIYSTLNQYINNKVIIECYIINFNLNKKNYYYLNNLKNSSYKSIQSFIFTIIDLIYYYKTFIKLDLNSSFIYDFLYSSYISHFISLSDSKIITGILLDKPVFSLIYKNKKNQKIFSLNEAFMFKPFRYFDYCDLDVYFYMNEYDKNIINLYGGKIEKYIKIPFFRKDLIKNNYNGLSKDFKRLLKNFNKKIIFAPTMASGKSYKPTSNELIERTIIKLIELTVNFPEILVIIKEKKDELKNINKNILNKIINQKNIYVVRSSKPKLLVYNQFEEIISECNLLLTLTSTSTTILQGLDKNVPFICINEYHPLSFYKNYYNCEIRMSNLTNAIDYWLKIDNNKKIDNLNKIKSDLNITNENGLVKIANILIENVYEQS